MVAAPRPGMTAWLRPLADDLGWRPARAAGGQKEATRLVCDLTYPAGTPSLDRGSRRSNVSRSYHMMVVVPSGAIHRTGSG